MLTLGLLAPARADGASGSIAVGDMGLAYLEMGEDPAVVIIHGVGMHKQGWHGAAEVLSADHRVFAIDLLGLRLSSRTGDDQWMPVWTCTGFVPVF